MHTGCLCTMRAMNYIVSKAPTLAQSGFPPPPQSVRFSFTIHPNSGAQQLLLTHTHIHTQPDTKHWGVVARASTYILYLWNEETRHRHCFYVQLTISAAATAIAMNSDIILQAKSYYPYSSAHERMTRFINN